jgi:hypothetical protein
MRQIDDYVPVEIWREAKAFVKDVSEDVEIYKIIQNTGNLRPCEEADKFCAYWNLESYEKYPHALITLYEAKPLIESHFETSDVITAFSLLITFLSESLLITV